MKPLCEDYNHDDMHRQEPQAPIGDIIVRSGFDSPSNYFRAKRKYREESIVPP